MSKCYTNGMPKNSSIAILRRWRALDRALSIVNPLGGLNLKKFAKQWHVSEKTIGRDLVAFEMLGQRVWVNQTAAGKDFWLYRVGTRPLFFCNGERSR
jgi:hypothetical protein